MRAFRELGDLTSAHWNKLGRNLDSLPEAAVAAFAESDFLNRCNVNEIIGWLARSADVPEQYGKDFAQPPINIFVGDGFYIEVLFWIDATTAIHEHSFAGAFGVLEGSSVHSKYEFELLNPISTELQIGNLMFLSSELLRRGDVRAIRLGNKFIHSLFHLQRPSVSVVIRSKGRADRVQYSYWKPYVAIDPFYADEALKVKLRLLDSLESCDSQMFWTYANALVENTTPWIIFNVLMRAYHKSETDVPGWQEFVTKLIQQCGSDVIAYFGASIQEAERTRLLHRLRMTVHSPNHRFFLALLLNVPDREILLGMVSKEYRTKEPKSLVIQWIKELAAAGVFKNGLDSGLLEIIELAVQYGSFERAKKAVASGESTSHEKFREEGQMKKLWDEANSTVAFRPLFCSKV